MNTQELKGLFERMPIISNIYLENKPFRLRIYRYSKKKFGLFVTKSVSNPTGTYNSFLVFDDYNIREISVELSSFNIESTKELNFAHGFISIDKLIEVIIDLDKYFKLQAFI